MWVCNWNIKTLVVLFWQLVGLQGWVLAATQNAAESASTRSSACPGHGQSCASSHSCPCESLNPRSSAGAGNPFVTPDTTRDVVITARLSAVNVFFDAIEKLMFELSIWRCSPEMQARCRLSWLPHSSLPEQGRS